jgi:hypothetical protein
VQADVKTVDFHCLHEPLIILAYVRLRIVLLCPDCRGGGGVRPLCSNSWQDLLYEHGAIDVLGHVDWFSN